MKRTLLALLVLLGACNPEVGDRLRQVVTNPAPRELEEPNLPVEDEVKTDEDEPDVRFVFDTSAPRAWVVTAVEGEAGGAEAEPNPTLVLQVGQRYTLENPHGTVHPLELRDEAGAVLLGQGSDRGRFAEVGEVDAEIDDDELGFSLTESLAKALFSYGCAVHPEMAGRVLIVR